MNRACILVATILSLVLVLNARAHQNKRTVIGTGGGKTTVQGRANYAVIGQTAVGMATDDTHVNFAGFFYVLEPMTGVEEEKIQLPLEFALNQNYPNPFNPSTAITYGLPEAAGVKLTVYNILGQVVAILVDEFQEAGYHSCKWNAGNVPSGVYFYQITAGKFAQSRKMLIVK